MLLLLFSMNAFSSFHLGILVGPKVIYSVHWNSPIAFFPSHSLILLLNSYFSLVNGTITHPTKIHHCNHPWLFFILCVLYPLKLRALLWRNWKLTSDWWTTEFQLIQPEYSIYLLWMTRICLTCLRFLVGTSNNRKIVCKTALWIKGLLSMAIVMVMMNITNHFSCY